jgi:hypothetical protein
MTLPSLEGDSNRLRGTGSPAVIEMRTCQQDGDYSESCSVDCSNPAALSDHILAPQHTANTHVKMGADA